MLVQAMVAIGLISIASYFMAQMFVDQYRQIRTIEMKQESIDLRNMLTMTFMSSSTYCPIGNTSIADYDFIEGSSGDVSIKSVLNYCPSSSNPTPPVLVSSERGPEFRFFTIKDFSLINITQPDANGAPEKYLANLKVDLVNKEVNGRSLRFILLPISFSTKTISSEPLTSKKIKASSYSSMAPRILRQPFLIEFFLRYGFPFGEQLLELSRIFRRFLAESVGHLLIGAHLE